MFQQLGTFFWGSTTAKAVTTATGCVSGIAIAITSVNAALPTVEPWFYATRGYVRDVVLGETGKLRMAMDPTRKAVIDLQIDNAWSRQRAVDDSKARWELQLEKAGSDDERLRIKSQVRDLDRERKELDSRMNELRKQRD